MGGVGRGGCGGVIGGRFLNSNRGVSGRKPKRKETRQSVRDPSSPHCVKRSCFKAHRPQWGLRGVRRVRQSGWYRQHRPFRVSPRVECTGILGSHRATSVAAGIALRRLSCDCGVVWRKSHRLPSQVTAVPNPPRTLNTAETRLPKHVLRY